MLLGLEHHPVKPDCFFRWHYTTDPRPDSASAVEVTCGGLPVDQVLRGMDGILPARDSLEVKLNSSVCPKENTLKARLDLPGHQLQIKAQIRAGGIVLVDFHSQDVFSGLQQVRGKNFCVEISRFIAGSSAVCGIGQVGDVALRHIAAEQDRKSVV